ncbi:uncharacterized protein [Anabrus simplex]|uniref:uncharacterized protein n=1 Tax=Anabrus simplex TaxID=316456 RepID=UPI0035A2710B
MSKRTVLCILLWILYVGTGETISHSTDANKEQYQDHLQVKLPKLPTSLLKKGSEKKNHGPLDKRSSRYDGPFKFHPEKLGWSDANQLCMKEKSYLATAMTLDETKMMVRILENQSQAIEKIHAGFQDILKHGEYVDASGRHLASDSYVRTFLDSSPGPNKHCGIMHIAGHFALEACDKPLPFFCRRFKSPIRTSLVSRIKNSHIVKFFRKLFV